MSRRPVPRTPPPSSRAAPPRARRDARGGTLLGVFIGLVLGIVLAAGVALYVTGGWKTYQQLVAAREAREAPAAPAQKGAKADAEKPRFDFYKILPGGEEPKIAADRKAAERPDRAVAEKAASKAAEPAKAADRPPEKVAVAEPSAEKGAKPGDRFWLQAGSFAQESDAENLKARLALAGWEAQVQPGTVPDKGVRYRVRLGPYDNPEELNRIKVQLAQRGFDAAVIRY